MLFDAGSLVQIIVSDSSAQHRQNNSIRNYFAVNSRSFKFIEKRRFVKLIQTETSMFAMSANNFSVAQREDGNELRLSNDQFETEKTLIEILTPLKHRSRFQNDIFIMELIYQCDVLSYFPFMNFHQIYDLLAHENARRRDGARTI